jgi:hypothetical protein
MRFERRLQLRNYRARKTTSILSLVETGNQQNIEGTIKLPRN